MDNCLAWCAKLFSFFFALIHVSLMSLCQIDGSVPQGHNVACAEIASYPGLQRREKAWYTLFVHAD